MLGNGCWRVDRYFSGMLMGTRLKLLMVAYNLTLPWTLASLRLQFAYCAAETPKLSHRTTRLLPKGPYYGPAGQTRGVYDLA
jgi:hypothetical protein